MSDGKFKRKEAIALTYKPGHLDAPTVVAKGKGKIAENILEKAKEHAVPIQEDASLVELLGKLDINQSIPEELYQAVAEVFAFVYRVDKERGEKLISILKKSITLQVNYTMIGNSLPSIYLMLFKEKECFRMFLL